MTTKSTNKKSPSAKNLSDKQIRRIWSELDAKAVHERLRAMQPDAKWSLSGSRLRACCPYHADSTPSFDVHLSRGYAKCWGCDTFVSDPIKLWSRIKKCPYAEALTDLKQSFGLKFLSNQAQAQLKSWERNQLLKRHIMRACHQEMMDAHIYPDDPTYGPAQRTVEWLTGARQIPEESLSDLDIIGVMPPVARIMQRLDDMADAENSRRAVEAEKEQLEKVESFVSLATEAQEYLQAAAGWVGAIVFRLDVAPDSIGRLKLRQPDSKNIIFLADAYEEELGFFGLGWKHYGGLLGAQKQYVPGVYVVEGEFDALTTMARQATAHSFGFPVVAAGGMSTAAKLDELQDFGFEEIYLVGDAPGNKGDELVKAWLPSIKRMRARVFTGYSGFPPTAQDPDEVVLAIGLAAYSRIMLDLKNREYWQTPPDWVFDKLQPEIEAVDDTDIRFRIEIASGGGRLLKNNIECDLFVEACARAYGLPAAQLKREIVAKEEDEPGFILRLVDVLSQVFYVVGQKAGDKDRKVLLWHKESRRMIQVALADDASIEREFAVVLGPAYQFFADKVGIPAFLEPSDVKKELGRYLQELDKSCRWYYRQALSIFAANAPDYDAALHMGAGIHVVKSKTNGSPSVYFVNGRDVYFGAYDADGVLRWNRLDGPSHEGYIFDVGVGASEMRWAKSVNGVEDLDRANSISIQNLWNRLHPILDQGWRFKGHSVTAEYLTGHLLATTVFAAFRRKIMVAFHADTRAGKSMLATGLIGGVEHPRMQLFEIVHGMQNYSAAGVKQDMTNKGRALALDEAEDDGTGDRKSKTVSEVLEMFRGLTGETNVYTMGSRHGAAQHFNLTFNVFLAAINPARRAQDANRMMVVNMEKTDKFTSPDMFMLTNYGEEYVQQLRRDLTVGLLPHIPKLQELYREIEKEFSDNTKPLLAESRYMEGLYQAMTVMKLLGRDYATFAKEFVDLNKERLDNNASQSESANIFSYVLHSPCFYVKRGESDGRGNMTLAQLLSTPELRDEINKAAAGVLYDADAEVIVVNWTHAVQTVLHQHPRFSKETNVLNIRDLANRLPHALKPSELTASGAMARLRKYGLTSVEASQVTAYRVAYITRPSTVEATLSVKMADRLPTDAAEIIPLKKATDDGDF